MIVFRSVNAPSMLTVFALSFCVDHLWKVIILDHWLHSSGDVSLVKKYGHFSAKLLNRWNYFLLADCEYLLVQDFSQEISNQPEKALS